MWLLRIPVQYLFSYLMTIYPIDLNSSMGLLHANPKTSMCFNVKGLQWPSLEKNGEHRNLVARIFWHLEGNLNNEIQGILGKFYNFEGKFWVGYCERMHFSDPVSDNDVIADQWKTDIKKKCLKIWEAGQSSCVLSIKKSNFTQKHCFYI